MADPLQFGPTMPKPWVCAFGLGLVACGGAGFRHEMLGRSTALIAMPGGDASTPVETSTAPGAGAIAVHAGDTLEIAWTINQPRAEKLQYAFSCAGATTDAIEAGETFEDYRVRRIAELRARRDRDRAAVATVASALVPSVAAGAQVQTPNASADVAVGVDRQAVGSAVAATVVSDDIVLAPDDLGGGALTGTLELAAISDGSCAMTVYSDDPGVSGMFVVHRRIDLGAEKRAREVARQEAAINLRGSVVASLHAQGAHDRVIELPRPVEPVEVAVAPPEVTATATATVTIDYAAEAAVIRGRYIEYLTGTCHGNPHHREEVAQEQERRRTASIELRGRLYAQLIGFGADPEYRYKLELAAAARDQARRDAEAAQAAAQAAIITGADATRVAMIDYLVSLGARLRPPMPAPLDEDPGAPPFSGASWIAGVWIWSGVEWQWQAGGWNDPTVFGSDPVDNGVTVVTTSNTSTTTTSTTTTSSGGSWVDRDHRTDGGSGTVILSQPGRDHTTTNPSGGTVITRDHRDKPKQDDKKDDDGKVIVRDHRR